MNREFDVAWALKNRSLSKHYANHTDETPRISGWEECPVDTCSADRALIGDSLSDVTRTMMTACGSCSDIRGQHNWGFKCSQCDCKEFVW